MIGAAATVTAHAGRFAGPCAASRPLVSSQVALGLGLAGSLDLVVLLLRQGAVGHESRELLIEVGENEYRRGKVGGGDQDLATVHGDLAK